MDDHKTILIVDDTAEHIDFLAELLCEDYKLLAARNGEKAIQIANSPKPPDLILLDIVMPGLDGYQVCKKLKENDASKDIPIIFLTAKDDDSEEEKGLELGAVDYITKPFNPFIIRSRIKTQISLKLVQNALTQKNKELEELNSTKDKIFSIIAHDLKSPILSFLSVSNTLTNKMDGLSREKIQTMAKEANQAGNHLYKLLENLLNWARIQMNRYEFKPKPIPLDFIIQDTFNVLQLAAINKGINLKSKVEKSTTIVADVDMLSTIMLNLVSNAIKFTNRDDTITIRYQLTDQAHKISISDTGVGMDETQLNKLFSLGISSTCLGTEKEKGTGLGLILCKEMVEKHNGKIDVESKLGVGTTFKVFIDRNLS